MIYHSKLAITDEAKSGVQIRFTITQSMASSNIQLSLIPYIEE